MIYGALLIIENQRGLEIFSPAKQLWEPGYYFHQRNFVGELWREKKLADFWKEKLYRLREKEVRMYSAPRWKTRPDHVLYKNRNKNQK